MAQELTAATESYNELPHDHLQGMDPNQVIGSKDLIFSLQEDAGNGYAEDDQVVRRRDAKLEAAGDTESQSHRKRSSSGRSNRVVLRKSRSGRQQIPSERCPPGQTLRP